MKYLLAPITMFGTALIGLVMATPVDAETCRTCRVAPGQDPYYQNFHPVNTFHDSTGYHQPSVNHRQIVRLIDVAQINPAYSSAYTPQGSDAAAQAAIQQQLSQLTQQLTTLTALVNRQAAAHTAAPPPKQAAPTEGAPAPAQSQAPAAPTPPPLALKDAGSATIGLAVLSAKCAACHQTGKLAPDQKFTLLDIKGQLVPLTDKQKLRVTMKTYSGQMPPPKNSLGIPAVTDTEFAAIMAMLQPGS